MSKGGGGRRRGGERKRGSKRRRERGRERGRERELENAPASLSEGREKSGYVVVVREEKERECV